MDVLLVFVIWDGAVSEILGDCLNRRGGRVLFSTRVVSRRSERNMSSLGRIIMVKQEREISSVDPEARQELNTFSVQTRFCLSGRVAPGRSLHLCERRFRR